jgi:siroheme synthase (precorrin-2 oxidase/ferrochelatase)
MLSVLRNLPGDLTALAEARNRVTDAREHYRECREVLANCLKEKHLAVESPRGKECRMVPALSTDAPPVSPAVRPSGHARVLANRVREEANRPLGNPEPSWFQAEHHATSGQRL